MPFYNRNLDVIKKNNSKLYEAIIKYDNKDEIDGINLETGNSKDGTHIIIAHKDGKRMYMNSPYNTFAETKKFVAQYDNRVIDYSVMTLFGLGNGVIEQYMIDSMPQHITYLIYEPSPNMFFHVMHDFDLNGIFECGRVRLVVRGLNDENLEALLMNMITIENYKITFCDHLPKYKELYQDEYENFVEKYTYIVNLIRINIGTRRAFAREIAYNELFNMKYIPFGNTEDDFEGLFPVDFPAVLVAAGPSLEKNVQVLKKMKGKALIIAVDTALRYLVSEGVYPDVAVAADPHKPLQLFQDDRVRKIPLAIHASVNYKAVELMSEGKILYVSADSAYYDNLYKMIGKRMYRLSTGGSVSTVAFTLAVAWGFRRLVLVGQDLALSKDKVHAGKDDIDVEKLTNNKIAVEGYYGEDVYTSPDYAEYIKWYNMVIENDPDLEVINATEGGARLNGTIQMPLSEVADKYCNGEFDFEGTIINMKPSFSNESRLLVHDKWKTSVDNTNFLASKFREGIELVDKSVAIINEGNYDKDVVENTHKMIDKLIAECNEMDEIYFVDQLTAGETEDILGDIYYAEKDNDKEHCRILEKLKKYLELMEKASTEAKSMFEQLIDKAV